MPHPLGDTDAAATGSAGEGKACVNVRPGQESTPVNLRRRQAPVTTSPRRPTTVTPARPPTTRSPRGERPSGAPRTSRPRSTTGGDAKIDAVIASPRRVLRDTRQRAAVKAGRAWGQRLRGVPATRRSGSRM